MITFAGAKTAAALLQCASCRFAVFYFVPFYGAFAEVRPMNVQWFLLGAVYWLLHSMGTETVNRLSDRAEDAVNRPERTALCERVGFTRLRHISIGLWVSVAILDVIFVLLHPSVLLAVLLVLAGLSSLNYSYGLRLARNRYAAPLLLTFHFGGTFMIGWVIANQVLNASAWRSFSSVALPFIVVSCGTLVALGGVKDLTDVRGDEGIDYHSLWVTVAREHGKWLSWLLVLTTFVLTGAFVATGLYPLRFLISFALVPVAILLRQCLWNSTTATEEMATRELFYQYWMLYLVVTVVLYAPSAATSIVVVCTLAYWVITTQFLHWSGGVQQQHLGTVSNLAFRTGHAARIPRREVSDD